MSYELYKPLRNYLRQFPLLDSLGVIRAYLQNQQFNQPFPRDIQVDRSYTQAASRYERGVFEWELEILAKELILNAPNAGPKDLKRWHEFSTAVNKLKELENETVRHYQPLYSKNILQELHRTAHRQFPWQQRPDSSTINRYLKIFGHPELDSILRAHIGLSATELYTFGLLFTGHYLQTFGINFPVTIEAPGVAQEQLDRFISRFAIEIADLREKISQSQSYNQDYAYSFNPLKVYPLVWVVLRGKRTLISPVPTYLFRRFTEGVYYEVYDAPGFSSVFGKAFQEYVGDVLKATNEARTFAVLPEQPYHVGKELKDSVDWIVSDETAALFVECKTKKLRYAAKFALTSSADLDADLEKMATFIVQIYKTMQDAKNGHYVHWKDDGRPIYPVVVTLEDWYAFGDQILSAIDEKVEEKLQRLNMDPALLGTSSYTICAVSDFEAMVQVMGRTSIDEVLRKKSEGERRVWSVRPFLMESFKEHLAQIRRDLFPDTIDQIRPRVRESSATAE